MAPEQVWYMQWDFWLSVFTLLLAGATLWLACETRRMRKGSDEAMANMVQHASHSAKAAGISADAAVKSAESTKILAEAGQRAWITFEEPLVEAKDTSFPAPVAHIVKVVSTLKNCGKTPAVEVRAQEFFELFEQPPTDIPNLDPGNVTSGTVGADSMFQMQPKGDQFRDERLKHLMTGHAVLLLYGVCQYKDIFGKPHRTRWCLKYMPLVRRFATYSGEHNDIE
jgi:hypothetical protein